MDYRDRYFKVRNNDGDEIIIDRYMPKSYKKFARHFMNYCRLNRITYFKSACCAYSGGRKDLPP